MRCATFFFMLLCGCTFDKQWEESDDPDLNVDLPDPEDTGDSGDDPEDSGTDSGDSGDTDDEPEDLDGDGFTVDQGDCDDDDPDVNPGADEIPYDGKDNDCDPSTRDDDIDEDGFGIEDDCDDDDDDVNPDTEEEAYDGKDNDCDPSTRDDDIDEDGFGIEDDCNDNDSYINPDMPDDQCDGTDDNCDGSPDNEWEGDFLEPNDLSPVDFGELEESEEIPLEAYISPEYDIDSYMVFIDDGWGPDFGLDVILETVPSSLDLAIVIDFVDEDGVQHNSVAEVDEGGLGEGESLSYGSLFSDSTGWYIIHIYANAGSSCTDPYTLRLIETGLL